MPETAKLECLPNCGACCIAPSINSPLPGMPEGKPAGVACLHLTVDRRCALFGSGQRPDVCQNFQPSEAICGQGARHALAVLHRLEVATAPDPSIIAVSG